MCAADLIVKLIPPFKCQAACRALCKAQLLQVWEPASRGAVPLSTESAPVNASCTAAMPSPTPQAPMVVSIEAPAHLAILSNMPEAQRSSSDSGRVLVEFLPTPPMSTYLTAVAVGGLEAVTQSTAG